MSRQTPGKTKATCRQARPQELHRALGSPVEELPPGQLKVPCPREVRVSDSLPSGNTGPVFPRKLGCFQEGEWMLGRQKATNVYCRSSKVQQHFNISQFE